MIIRGLCYAALYAGAHGSGWAQNLVPNPSFEEYTLCPSNISQIERAAGWSSLSGSSDYFNACAVNDSMGVPLSQLGFQYASTGQAYAGVATFAVGMPYYRENIGTFLTSPMVPGTTYYLSMKVSPGGFGSDPNNSARWASNGIGMKFFTQVMAPGIYQDNQPAMWLQPVLRDTSAWTTVSASFMADSAYQYLLIGCLWEDSFLDTVLIDATALLDGAYSFIDDVCVSTQPGYCDAGNGIQENDPPSLYVEGNVVGDDLVVHIDGGHLPATLYLIDTSGRICMVAPARSPIMQLSLSGLASGHYTLIAHSSQGFLQPFPIVRSAP